MPSDTHVTRSADEEMRIKDIVEKVLNSDTLVDKLISKIKDSILDEFKREVQAYKEQVEILESDLYKAKEELIYYKDNSEMYSRRNSIRVFGIPQVANTENTDTIIIDMCKEKLGIEIHRDFIDSSHRLYAKEGFVVAISIFFILVGIIVAVFFMSWVNLVIDHEIVLKNGSQAFGWWAKPPVVPMISVYVYNVTNADEFLNNGSKPIVDELGPYVYLETWERKNIQFNENGTVSYNLQKIYRFSENLSAGMEDDVVVVPNIPMLSATSQSKHAARFLRLAMASIMDILKIKPFVEVSVGQLLWGYEDPLLKLAKDVVPKEQKLPYEEFGLMYNKNRTSPDVVTVFTGASDITKYGLIDTYNGRTHLPHWLNDKCNSLSASDGSIFPPHITPNTTLYIYEKDLCRTLPLKFEKEVKRNDNIPSYRFTPPTNVFGSVSENPDNMCYCPSGPPCSPSGLFNVSLCQFDSPVMISFPHFYLADDSFRTALEGISPPDPEKHKMYMDIQPMMGTAMSAKARIQVNLAVSQVVDIKQVATFPDIVFPIIWFEESVDGLPDEVTELMRLASEIPPIAHTAITAILIALGVILLLIAVWRLVRGAHRASSLQLATGHFGQPTQTKDLPMSNVRN